MDINFNRLSHAEKLSLGDSVWKNLEAAEDSPAEFQKLKLNGPASPAQCGFLFLDQAGGNAADCKVFFAEEVSGPLQMDLLQRSLEFIMEKHPALRVAFQLIDGMFEQTIQPLPVKIPWNFLDLSGLNAGSETILHIIRSELEVAFDVKNCPLWKFVCVRTSPRNHVFAAIFHHALCDAESIRILRRDLGEAYNRQLAGLPLSPTVGTSGPVEVSERAWARMNSPERGTQEAYWRSVFPNKPAVLKLGSMATGERVPMSGNTSINLILPDKLCKKIRDFERNHETTIFTLLMAVFHCLICRYTQEDEVLVATPVSIRSEEEREVVGCFLNTVLIRSDLLSAISFDAFLQQMKRTVIGAMDHRQYPFDLLITLINAERMPGRSPATPIFFSYLEESHVDLKLSGLEISPFKMSKTGSNFDLCLWVQKTKEIFCCTFEYKLSLYTRGFVRGMADLFMSLLDQFLSNRNLCIHQVDLHVQELGTAICQLPPTPIMLERAHSSFLDMFDVVSRGYSDRTAVATEDGCLTYLQLEKLSRHVSWCLHQEGIRSDDRVGLFLERSDLMLAIMIGAWRTGACLVPLDPVHPDERLHHILEDSSPLLVISDEAHERKLDSIWRGRRLPTSAFNILSEHTAKQVPTFRISGASSAYVMYTSGSTGKPKGVVISHRNLSNFLQSMALQPGVRKEDVVASITTVNFDISMLELFLPLCAGASVVILPRETASHGSEMIKAIRKYNITVLQATPATWKLMLQTGFDRQKLPIKAFCGGEILTPQLAEHLLLLIPELWNLYGPTETTVWSSAMRVTDPVTASLLGNPVANTSIYVLDSWFNRVPIGVIGEIFIGGKGVGDGYINAPGRTASSFLPDPFCSAAGQRMYRTGDLGRFLDTGELEILGRNDSQVKIHGFRIELGEIEQALLSCPRIEDAVVLLDRSQEEPRLIAYLKTNGNVNAEDLLDHLKPKIPYFMLPGKFLFLQQFPLTASGKVDKSALARMPAISVFGTQVQNVPLTFHEKLLFELWNANLPAGVPSIDTHFLLAGGHSFLAVKLINELRAVSRKVLTLSEFWNSATIREQAKILDGKGPESSHTNFSVEIHPSAIVPLSIVPPDDRRESHPNKVFLMAPALGTVGCYRNLAEKLSPFGDCYGIQTLDLEKNGRNASLPVLVERCAGIIEEICKNHDAVILGGWSFGGILAWQAAQQLTLRKCNVKLVFALDSFSCNPDKMAVLSPLPPSEVICRFLVNFQEGRELEEPIRSVVFSEVCNWNDLSKELLEKLFKRVELCMDSERAQELASMCLFFSQSLEYQSQFKFQKTLVPAYVVQCAKSGDGNLLPRPVVADGLSVVAERSMMLSCNHFELLNPFYSQEIFKQLRSFLSDLEHQKSSY